MLQFTWTLYGLFIVWLTPDIIMMSLFHYCLSHSFTLLHSDIIMTSLLHFTPLWLHYDIITPIVLWVYKSLGTCMYFPSLVLLKYTWVLAKASCPCSSETFSLSQVLWGTIRALLSFVTLVTLVVHKQVLCSLSGRENPCHLVAHCP